MAKKVGVENFSLLHSSNFLIINNWRGDVVTDDSRRYGHLDIVSFFLLSQRSMIKALLQTLPLIVPLAFTVACSSADKSSRPSAKSDFKQFDQVLLGVQVIEPKKVDLADPQVTLSSVERRYNIQDLKLVASSVRCSDSKEELSRDIYQSQEKGALISVSMKGDLQTVVIDDKFRNGRITKSAACQTLR